jgi:hypothetical protein
MYTTLSSDHTQAVVAERLRRAGEDRLVRLARRTTPAADAPRTPARSSRLARWSRRVRLQTAH